MANSFDELKRHVGHRVVVVEYGNPAMNVAIECMTCYEVLVDFDKYDDEEGGFNVSA